MLAFLYTFLLQLYEIHKSVTKQLDKEMKKENPEVAQILLDLANNMAGPYGVYYRGNKEALDLLESKMKNKKIRQLIQNESKVNQKKTRSCGF